MLFSIVLAFGFLVFLGPGLHTLLVFVPTWVLAMLAFAGSWRKDFPTHARLLAARLILFFLAVSALLVLWVELFAPGQSGYGAELRFDYNGLTMLGFGSLIWNAFVLTVFVGFAKFASIGLHLTMLGGHEDER